MSNLASHVSAKCGKHTDAYGVTRHSAKVTFHTLPTGMNLLSKFCIAVSATRKLNCVAVGVICVAVFFGVLEKKILELRDTFPAQPVQGILKKRKIVLPLQR